MRGNGGRRGCLHHSRGGRRGRRHNKGQGWLSGQRVILYCPHTQQSFGRGRGGRFVYKSFAIRDLLGCHLLSLSFSLAPFAPSRTHTGKSRERETKKIRLNTQPRRSRIAAHNHTDIRDIRSNTVTNGVLKKKNVSPPPSLTHYLRNNVVFGTTGSSPPSSPPLACYVRTTSIFFCVHQFKVA